MVCWRGSNGLMFCARRDALASYLRVSVQHSSKAELGVWAVLARCLRDMSICIHVYIYMYNIYIHICTCTHTHIYIYIYIILT